jgi:hypothetical protein
MIALKVNGRLDERLQEKALPFQSRAQFRGKTLACKVLL